MPMLASKGMTADYQPDISPTEILEIIGTYEGVVVRSKITINEAFLQKATRLQFIARAGAGLDQIDIEAVKRRGIPVFNAPEGNRDAVAEHALGMLLGLMNNLRQADAQVRQKIWDREGNRAVELKGKTVGIIGYGNTGRELAQRIHAFGCHILAYDKYQTNFSDAFVTESSFEDILDQAEIVSLHVPLTSETHFWFTASVFNRFRHPIFFINTARGEIVSLTALMQGLQQGKIRGAGLDVLENEKLATFSPTQQQAFDYLCQSDQVLMSPHVAGWTHESYVKINEVLVHKIVTHFEISK